MRKNKYHTSEGNIHKTCAIRLVYDSCAYTVGTTLARVCILELLVAYAYCDESWWYLGTMHTKYAY